MKKKALITGIFGQDGSYLTQILSEKGYEVYGIARSTLSQNSQRIKKELELLSIRPTIFYEDLNDYEGLKRVLLEIRPSEIYHVAAFHVSSEACENREYLDKQLFDYNVKSTSNLLSLCYLHLKDTKVLIAGSCLMFDGSETESQDENTPFKSQSLYGLAKIVEQSLVQFYRSKGLFSCCAILYNHESPRRSSSFVTQKIVENLVKIKFGKSKSFTLSNLDVKKDWGYAKDYAYAMTLMLQQKKPQDFIISSSSLHSIAEFCEECARVLELPNWMEYLTIDSNITTRKVKSQLFGMPYKAKEDLQWTPTVDFYELVSIMIAEEVKKYGK